MRTHQLVQSLTESEIAEVELLLNDGKRRNLLALFKHFKKYRQKDAAPAVKDLLQKVFKQKWSKPAELQLRNKLSRLNDILYEYLVLQEFKRQLTDNESLFNLWKINAFHTRKLPMLTEELEAGIKTALQNFMLDEALPMLRLRGLMNQGNFETALKHNDEWQQYEQHRFLLHYALAGYTRAHHFNLEQNRTQTGQSVWKQYHAPDYKFNFTENRNEWYFRLYENARRALTTTNAEEELAFLKKAAEAIRGVKTKHLTLRGVHGNLLLNIAVGLLRKSDMEQAHSYLLQYMQQQKNEGIPISAVGWLNYIVTLNCLGKLNETKAVYTANRQVIEQSQFAPEAKLCYCAACLFTDETDKALKVLRTIPIRYDHEKLITRNLYAIAFIMRGEYKLAHTELTNLKRAITGYERNDYLKDLEQVTALLEKYNTALRKSKAQRKVLLEQLHRENKKVMKLFADDPVQWLILKWLRKL